MKKRFAKNKYLIARLGNLGWAAEDGVVKAFAAGGNIVVAHAVRTRIRERIENLAGQNASSAEYLLARRRATTRRSVTCSKSSRSASRQARRLGRHSIARCRGPKSACRPHYGRWRR